MEVNEIWYARPLTDSPAQLGMIEGSAWPSGSINEFNLEDWVKMTNCPELIIRAELLKIDGMLRISRLLPGPRFQENSHLWYSLTNTSRGPVPALTLTAFNSSDAPRGAIISPSQTFEGSASSASSAGSLRWLVGSGAIHQIIVSPEHRRQKVASQLLFGAELLCKAHGWPGLYGGDDRTQLGDELIRSLPSQIRAGREKPWVSGS